MSETDGVLRERIRDAVREARRDGLGGMTEAEALDRYADALLPLLAAEVAEAKRDADMGWKHAQEQQDQCAEWAATCKRLMAHVEQLSAWTSRLRGGCNAVATTATGLLGPCTIGPHHPSFPHKDASGARWQVLQLPADGEVDDLTARLAAAYYARFDNDGHPEDSEVAAEVARTVLGPELDRLAAEVAELRECNARALELLKQVPHEVLPGVPGHDHLSVRRAIAALDGSGGA